MSADERRARWNEPLPTVELGEAPSRRGRSSTTCRWTSCFALPAPRGRSATTAAELLYDAGLVPDTLQFLIDGEVRFDDGARMVAPGPLAFEEMLAGRPVGSAMSCRRRRRHAVAHAGRVPHAALDNIDIAHGLFRMLIEHARRRGPERCHARPACPTWSRARRGRPAADGTRAAAARQPPDCRRARARSCCGSRSSPGRSRSRRARRSPARVTIRRSSSWSAARFTSRRRAPRRDRPDGRRRWPLRNAGRPAVRSHGRQEPNRRRAADRRPRSVRSAGRARRSASGLVPGAAAVESRAPAVESATLSATAV